MNTFGTLFRITTFGESHGASVGVVVDGCPAGIKLFEEDIQKELDRRRPGQSAISTPRQELDRVEILSGVFENKTTGHPIMMLVKNTDQRSQDYGDIKDKYRPSHADYTYDLKYGLRDYRGGGRSSARETIGRVAAGALAKKLLTTYHSDIQIYGHVVQVGDVRAKEFDPLSIEKNPVRSADPQAAKKMEKLIREIQNQQDSIGGIVEVRVLNTPKALGDPVFNKIKATLAHAMMSLPGVKGFEYGSGFATASMRGSEHNDAFYKDGEVIRTKTNHHGGILGGITTGEDLVFRMVLKPTSSIPQEQKTVDNKGCETKIQTFGRHDPCLCPRLVPIAEAMTSLVLADHVLLSTSSKIT